MSTVVKLSGTLLCTPLGATVGGVDAEIDLGAYGPGVAYEDVRQREVWHINTEGAVGEHFVDLDVPAQLGQLFVRSRNLSEIALRLNGTPASLHGYGAAFDALTTSDFVSLSIDQSPAQVIGFDGVRSIDEVIARINGRFGYATASRAEDGQLVLVGRKSGGRYASERGWQHGSIVVAGPGTSLGRLGLGSGGTFYGDAVDLGVSNRLLLEPPTFGKRAITRIEVSGSGELVTHVAGF